MKRSRGCLIFVQKEAEAGLDQLETYQRYADNIGSIRDDDFLAFLAAC